MIRTITATSLMALIATPLAAQDREGWPQSFTVGTASQGGTYYTYGSGFANLIAEKLGGMTGAGEVTGGPTQNLALVQSGDLALGMTTMGPARDALAGESPLAPGMAFDKVCAMFPMYQTPFSLVSLKGSGIDSVENIPAGATIAFGPAGGTSDIYFPQFLEALGADFEKRTGGYEDLGGQLQDGLIDAIGYAAGIPIPGVSQLEAQIAINVVGFKPEQQAQLVEQFPVSEFQIPADTYKSISEPLDVVAMWNFAIVNCDLPEEFVYEATKAVMDNHEAMMTIHQSAAETLPENVDKNGVLPWHPGAARYFEEAGQDIPDDMVYGS
jgi:uncharacterized protein